LTLKPPPNRRPTMFEDSGVYDASTVIVTTDDGTVFTRTMFETPATIPRSTGVDY
jgi:hypothetical protein